MIVDIERFCYGRIVSFQEFIRQPFIISNLFSKSAIGSEIRTLEKDFFIFPFYQKEIFLGNEHLHFESEGFSFFFENFRGYGPITNSNIKATTL
jgi:hypothetical protein